METEIVEVRVPTIEGYKFDRLELGNTTNFQHWPSNNCSMARGAMQGTLHYKKEPEYREPCIATDISKEAEFRDGGEQEWVRMRLVGFVDSPCSDYWLALPSLGTGHIHWFRQARILCD